MFSSCATQYHANVDIVVDGDLVIICENEMYVAFCKNLFLGTFYREHSYQMPLSDRCMGRYTECAVCIYLMRLEMIRIKTY